MPQRAHVPSTIESGETSGARPTTSAIWHTPSTAIPFRPRLRAPAAGQQRVRERLRRRRGRCCPDDDRDGLNHVRDAGGAVDAEIRHDRACEGQRMAANTGHGSGGKNTGERLERPPHASAGRLHRERQERDRADRREHRPRHEEQARPRVAPEHGQPGDGERGVHDGGRLGDVAEREDRHEEGDREADPRRPDRRGAAARASSKTSPGVQNGSSAAAKVTVPAASAAGISWRSSGIAAAAGLGATRRLARPGRLRPISSR